MAVISALSELEPYGGELEFSREDSALVEFAPPMIMLAKRKRGRPKGSKSAKAVSVAAEVAREPLPYARRIVRRRPRLSSVEQRIAQGIIDAPPSDDVQPAPAAKVSEERIPAELAAEITRAISPERIDIAPDASRSEAAISDIRAAIDEVTALRQRRAEMERIAAINAQMQQQALAAQMAQEEADRIYREEYALMMLLADAL